MFAYVKYGELKSGSNQAGNRKSNKLETLKQITN